MGFLAVQRFLDVAIMEEMDSTKALSDVQVLLQRFAYPPYADDDFIFIIQSQLPFFMILSFLATMPNITKDIVLEKERRLKVRSQPLNLRVSLKTIRLL